MKLFPLIRIGVALAFGAGLSAQTPESWRLVAFFWHESPNDERALAGIREGLAAWGHPHEIEVLQAGEDEGRAREQLAGLRRDPPALVFALGTRAALLCKAELPDQPVVFTAVTHPVESGVARGWSGSGSHLCGNSNWIGSRRLLEVFDLAVPDLRRLGVVRSRSAGVVSGVEVANMRRHLARDSDRAAGLEIVEEVVSDAAEIRDASARLVAAGVDAIWIPIDFTIYESLGAVLEAAQPAHVPLVSSSLRGIHAGALAGVVVDYRLLGRRAVLYGLEVLVHGRDPSKLPVGTLESYRVVVNLGAARALGYEPPLSLLVLADQILEDPKEERDGR